MLQAVPLLRISARRTGPSQAPRARRALTAFQAALGRYLDTACRPLLTLAPADADTLATHVRRLAVRTFDARVGVLQAFATLHTQAPAAARRVAAATDRAQDVLAKHAREAFTPDAAKSFVLGWRVAVQAIGRILTAVERDADVLTRSPSVAERLSLVCPWLDVAQAAVSWFLLDRGAWMQPAIAEEACFLVKEWGLEYAAVVDALVAPRGTNREPLAAGLTNADVAHDRAFADWATDVVAEAASG